MKAPLYFGVSIPQGLIDDLKELKDKEKSIRQFIIEILSAHVAKHSNKKEGKHA